MPDFSYLETKTECRLHWRNRDSCVFAAIQGCVGLPHKSNIVPEPLLRFTQGNSV